MREVSETGDYLIIADRAYCLYLRNLNRGQSDSIRLTDFTEIGTNRRQTVL